MDKSKQIVTFSLLFCCTLSILIARDNPKRLLLFHFTKGIRKGLFDVIVLLIASKLFIEGFVACFGESVISNCIKELDVFQIPAAIVITFLFSIFTGSGDAIITSIASIVIPCLAVPIRPLACSMIWFSGEMGRCASPISAATITVAKIASVESNKIALKALLPITSGLLIASLILLLLKH